MQAIEKGQCARNAFRMKAVMRMSILVFAFETF